MRVEADELVRLQANEAARTAALAARAPVIDRWIGMADDLELVLIKAVRFAKAPIEKAWQCTEFHEADDLRGWLRGGGNVDLHLGASELVAWDADNALGTVAMFNAGVDMFTVSAGSRDPEHDHAGGVHVLWRIPEWLRGVSLDGQPEAVALANGGRIDVLAGNHALVMPPSVVITRPNPLTVLPYLTASQAGYCEPDRDGWLNAEATGELPEAPLWAFDPALIEQFAPAGTVVGEPPAGLEALAGQFRERVVTVPAPRDPGDRDELTAAVDELDLLGIIERAGIAGERKGFDRCGPCEMWLRAGSDAAKSITVHDCGQHGARVQVWTTAFDGLPKGGYSRLDAYCGLTGVDRAKAIRELGLPFTSSNGPVSLLGWLDDAADAAEDAGDAEAAARHRAQAAAMRAAPKRVKGLGAVPAAASVAGVDRFTVAGAAPGVAGPPAESTDEVIEAELVDVDPVGLAERKVLRETRSAVAEIERQLRGAVDPNTKLWQGMTPGLGRIANFAESRGVYLHGLVAALLPRILAAVPPNVVLPPANRLCEHKAEGQGVNCYAINIAASSAGKGRTDDAAVAAIPLPDGVIEDGTGTSEHWSKLLRGKRDGTPYIKATSLLLNVDEMDTLNGFLSQPGNKMPGWLASTFMNGRGGQGTSDEKNSAVLPRHGSRIGILINAQYSKMDTLAALDGLGVGARFVKGMPGVVAHEDRGNLYGVRVPAVLADQSAQPWFTRGHVGEPACAAQQSPAWLAANRAAPTLAAPDAGAERVGVTGFDDAPAIWVELPETAWADIAAGEEVAAARAADLELAFDQDQEGLVSGHRILVRERVAFALAVLDGEHAIGEAHWEAAGVFLAGSDIVTAACAAWRALSGEAEAFKAGELKGIGYAASKAAETTITTRGVQSSMRAIVQRLQKVGGSAKPGYLSTGVKGKFSGMSTAQKRHMEQAFQVLERAGQVALAADGSWVLKGSLAVTAPPAA